MYGARGTYGFHKVLSKYQHYLTMNRIERMAAILLLLQEHSQTAGEIAGRFEVSRRTILRDIQALSEMGVPVTAREGPGGGYSLPGDYRPSPLPLTGNEAFLLLMALSTLQRLGDLPFRQERASLLAKLRALLPRSGLSSAGATLASTAVDIPERPQRAPFLEALLSAAADGRWIKAVYQSSQRTTTQHLLPRQVTMQDGFWYCRAYAHERGEERNYRADRFQSVQPPDADFQPGPAVESLPYDHESHPRVIARLTPRGAARIETDRHLGGRLQRSPDGSASLDMRCPPGDLDWYARLFASLGQDAAVLAPPELRRRIHAIGQILVAQYEKQ
jgi:predicted DNA-binding transcriptional regulator YafY